MRHREDDMIRLEPATLALGVILGLPSLAWGQAYNHGSPNDDEQLVLEMINRARKNPFAEGTRLGIDIREGLLTQAEMDFVKPMPPLAFNATLITVARAHSLDMYTRNFFAHTNPDGDDPFERMAAAGYTNGTGENIAVHSASNSGISAALEDLLMVDAGITGRGHRKNLLDIYPGSSPAREIGIGYTTNGTANGLGWRSHLTQDYGRRATGPFLVGVVYDDTGISFYAKGKGISGVRITPNVGTSFADTSASGGYACLLTTATTGTVTVTPTTGTSSILWPANIKKMRFLNGENLKVDFTLSEALDTDNDGLPDTWELANALNPGDPADAAADKDSDGSSNLDEYRFGSKPDDQGSTPANPLGSAATPPPSTPPKKDSGGGGCGLTGFGVLLPLLLARLRRR
jgi:hypothetical protein